MVGDIAGIWNFDTTCRAEVVCNPTETRAASVTYQLHAAPCTHIFVPSPSARCWPLCVVLRTWLEAASRPRTDDGPQGARDFGTRRVRPRQARHRVCAIIGKSVTWNVYILRGASEIRILSLCPVSHCAPTVLFVAHHHLSSTPLPPRHPE